MYIINSQLFSSLTYLLFKQRFRKAEILPNIQQHEDQIIQNGEVELYFIIFMPQRRIDYAEQKKNAP